MCVLLLSHGDQTIAVAGIQYIYIYSYRDGGIGVVRKNKRSVNKERKQAG
jgi:hypothetical protein